MKYLSELLHKKFDTEEECLQAEKEYQEKQEKELEEKKKLREERKARAEEIDVLYKKKEEAIKNYNLAVKKFINDYGSYHYSITSEVVPEVSIFDFFNSFWF